MAHWKIPHHVNVSAPSRFIRNGEGMGAKEGNFREGKVSRRELGWHKSVMGTLALKGFLTTSNLFKRDAEQILKVN